MMTVPQAALRTGKSPETIRRWIREGKLHARKIGTQHVIEEEDLDDLLDDEPLPARPGWDTTFTGEPMPNWVAIVRRSRASH